MTQHPHYRSALFVASLAVLCLSLPAAARAADDVSRTIHVPPGWEGAYDFGYAPVVRVGNLVIVSGVPAGGQGTYEERIRRMYEQAVTLLAEAGAKVEDVVELTTFHREAKDTPGFSAEFDRYMPIHREFFRDHRPAWTAVGTTALLSPTAPVEMRLMAVVGSGAASRVVRGSTLPAAPPKPAAEAAPIPPGR